MFKHTLKLIINFLINILLCKINLIIIFSKLFLINKADIIIFQNRRIGFGHIFTSIDLTRKMFKNKKILFIHFFDSSRFHNKKIFEFLLEEKIILYTSIFIKFRRLRFGEYDQYMRSSKENYFQLILIKIIKFFSKDNAKLFDIIQLYDYANKKNRFIKNQKYKFSSPNHQWLSYYYYLVEKNNLLKLDYQNSFIKEVSSKNSLKKICFYKREKNFIKKHTQNFNLYFKLIKMFHKKNFEIYLTGEYKNLIKKFPSIKGLVSLPEDNGNFNQSKNLAMQLASEYYIGDSGGGSYFALYKKKSLILGVPEETTYTNKVKIFRYSLYKNNKKIVFNKKFKKFLKKKTISLKAALDSQELSRMGFAIKSYNHNDVIKYVRQNMLN
jgi:hypothetical protein